MELVGFQHLDLLAAADVKTRQLLKMYQLFENVSNVERKEELESFVKVTLNILKNNISSIIYILMVSFVYLPDHNFLKLY